MMMMMIEELGRGNWRVCLWGKERDYGGPSSKLFSSKLGSNSLIRVFGK